MKSKLYSVILFFLISGLLLPGKATALDFIGHLEESAVSVYDQEGNYVFATVMGVSVEDRYISEDNYEYVIETVNGNRAIARKLGEVDLLEGISKDLTTLTPLAIQGKKLIGIYFTHNDESYKPGAESIEGKGEIHDVGKTLQSALEKKGIRVISSDNLHLPHDGAAYERSRSTALALMKYRPDALFDIHRDAIPRREEYSAQIAHQLVSQVRLVVGRQNPNIKVNDQFARQLKAIADNHHPGLVKGIFYGSGNYNQQVSPHSVLIEVGTHVSTLEEAQAASRLLSESIYRLLYGNIGEKVQNRENPGALSTIAWIIVIAIIGLFAYLYINEGSWEGVIKRIKNFFSREIIDRGKR